MIGPLSKFAFNFNLHHYSKEEPDNEIRLAATIALANALGTASHSCPF
jgi:hypothetical protein